MSLADSTNSRPDLHQGLGDSLYRAGRFAEAEAAFRNVLGLDPGSWPARYNLGVTHMKQGRLDDAAAELERALEIESESPRSAPAHRALGDIYRRRGEREKAAESFRRAAAAAARHFESQLKVGLLVLQGGRVAAATRASSRRRRSSPSTSRSTSASGGAYLAAGRRQDAFRSFLRVRRLYPESWRAAIGLALIHAGRGRQEQARELLADALEHGGGEARSRAAELPPLAPLLAELGG